MIARSLLTLLLLFSIRHVAEGQETFDVTKRTHTKAEIDEARSNLEKWKGIVAGNEKTDFVITESGYILADIDDTRGKLAWLAFGDRGAISKDVIEPGKEWKGRLVTKGETVAKQTTIPASPKKRVILIGEVPGLVQYSIVANGKDGAEPEELRYVRIGVEPLAVKPVVPPTPEPTKPEDIKTEDKLALAAIADIKAGKGTMLQAMKLAEFYRRVSQTIEKTDAKVFPTYGDFYGSLAEVGKSLAGDPTTVLPTFRADLATWYKAEIGGTMAQALDAAGKEKVAKTFKALADRLDVLK